MENLIGLFQQFVVLMDIRLLLTLLMATFLGVIIGALPGLSATMGIALLTGLTYQFPLSYTFAVLMGIYVGAIYGGSMSAILLNIPGTASAAATALEGHPLALQGKAETAIKVTRTASIIGTFVGVLVLTLVSPPMTAIALSFNSPEYFMLALFGVMICGSISTDDLSLKGWIGGLMGLLISMIGIDSMQGAPRFTFGNSDLMGGINMVPAMIGFYGIPEVIKAFVPKTDHVEVGSAKDQVKVKMNSWKIVFKHLRVVIQSSLLGVGIGALPGVGEDVAAWVSYNTAQRTSKHPEEYTHGSFEGVIAPEVGNNAAIGGALIPMLTLAVPGSPPAAVLLGSLMIHNIRPGPMIMRDNPDFINYISALLFLSVLTLWVAGMVLAKPMSKILKVPKVYLMPIVGILSIVGAYAINNSAFDILIVVIFGVFGYFLDKMHYSPAPIILGIILGNMIDSNFRRALTVSSGNAAVFFTHPISLLFFCIIVLMIFFQVRKSRKNTAGKAQRAPAVAADAVAAPDENSN